MRVWPQAILLAAVSSVGWGLCQDAPGVSQPLTTADAAAVRESAKAFALAVAHDITQEGPAAWRRHFADNPSFFMASEGHLVFPDGATATAAIQAFARTIQHMELHWGDDLRIDPLTPNFAIMAASWHEIRVSTDGSRVDESGFFTGTVERHDGRWQFRNAHWSLAVPPAPAR